MPPQINLLHESSPPLLISNKNDGRNNKMCSYDEHDTRKTKYHYESLYMCVCQHHNHYLIYLVTTQQQTTGPILSTSNRIPTRGQ